MCGDFRAARAAARCFVRRLVISGLSVMASAGLAGRANAEYLHCPDASRDPACARFPGVLQTFDCNTWHTYPNAGDYIDRTWYDLLDDGQYRYLDKGQYKLMAGSGYLLGHPCYPKLFERDSEQAVGFTSRMNAGWSGSGVGGAAIIEYAVSYWSFNAGDYVDRVRWHYLDKGQYDYLDKGQYNLLGGLGYLFGRSYHLAQYGWDAQLEDSVRFHAPEPSSIGFLGFGALLIITSKRYNRRRTGKLTEANRR